MGDMGMAPQNETQLTDLLTSPDDTTITAVEHLKGDLLILGAGGKMGPSLAQLAWRSIQAADLLRVNWLNPELVLSPLTCWSPVC